MPSTFAPPRRSPAIPVTIRSRATIALAAACLATGAAIAGNPPELAAEQLAIDRTSNTGVGDAINQEFAQVFEVYDTGRITHVMLPLNCLSSPMPVLRVTIQKVRAGMPSGRVLASQDVPGYVLDTYPAPTGELGLRMVQFDYPARVKPGTYAFTISGIGGLCQIWYGPLGNAYTGGDAYLSNQPGSQPGVPAAWNFPLGRDLTFQVFQQPN
jgi:hypothetical protein